mmetsp:Transcript_35718/g.79452  ORF Transcript_35718/g.79452 Transcript_35718/m.79452 type:complete len:219 (+) Transcript_35718:697-1353(+)
MLCISSKALLTECRGSRPTPPALFCALGDMKPPRPVLPPAPSPIDPPSPPISACSDPPCRLVGMLANRLAGSTRLPFRLVRDVSILSGRPGSKPSRSSRVMGNAEPRDGRPLMLAGTAGAPAGGGIIPPAAPPAFWPLCMGGGGTTPTWAAALAACMACEGSAPNRLESRGMEGIAPRSRVLTSLSCCMNAMGWPPCWIDMKGLGAHTSSPPCCCCCC